MIDFEPEPAVVDLRERVHAFVRDVVIPAEPRDLAAHGLDDALRRELQDEAAPASSRRRSAWSSAASASTCPRSR
jgi:hypothetical protein